MIRRLCSSFPSENRLPACTSTSGIDGASIWRCSQPKVGIGRNRSSADEMFHKHIWESAACHTEATDGKQRFGSLVNRKSRSRPMCDCDSMSSHTPSALYRPSLSAVERDAPNKLVYFLPLPEQDSTGMPLCMASPTHVTCCPGQVAPIVCSV